MATGTLRSLSRSLIIRCILQAASTASSAVVKVAITSSPMVLTTRPPWRSVALVITSMQRATVSRAFTSPSSSYSLVLPTTSANSTARVALGSAALAMHLVPLGLRRPFAEPHYRGWLTGPGRSNVRDDVGDPGRIGVAALGQHVLAVALAVAARLLPVNRGAAKAGFGE